MALNQSLSDDLNNWADAQSQTYLGVLEQVLSDTLNSWGDAQQYQLHYKVIFAETINNWQETLGRTFAIGASVSDTLSMSDAILVNLLGKQSATIADTLNNWNENLELRGDGLLKLEDTIDHWRDDVNSILEILLSLADDLDNYSDAVGARLLYEHVVSVASNLDNWNDAVTREFLSRLAQHPRTGMISYLRRYLNDVDAPPVVKHLSIGLADKLEMSDEVS